MGSCASSTMDDAKGVGMNALNGAVNGAMNTNEDSRIEVENMDGDQAKNLAYGKAEEFTRDQVVTQADTADEAGEAGAASENLRRAMEDGRTDIRKTQVQCG